MNLWPSYLTCAAFACLALNVSATVLYVDVNSANPTTPYTNWATAARVIQDAVDAALAGDQVLVSDGLYAIGGRGSNRVLVDRTVTLASVNGPQSTIIEGVGTVQCVTLSNQACLYGFTLTNSQRGLACQSVAEVVSNCIVTGNAGGWIGGGVIFGTLYNCVLTNNQAFRGGGAIASTLHACILSGNSSVRPPGSGASLLVGGGGAYQCTLFDCTLTNNSGEIGAGAWQCSLSNCTLRANSAFGTYSRGGGASDSALTNCIICGNSGGRGGGVYNCTLNSCQLSFNYSSYNQAAAYQSSLNNCTVTGNSGDGVFNSTLNNCIVEYNTPDNVVPANYPDEVSTLNYCCTTPLPTNGVGNVALDPQLGSASHLSAASPCRGAGSPLYSRGVDIDGEAWATPPSIGCDEYHPDQVIGPLTVNLAAKDLNVTTGFPSQWTAFIEGRTTASAWDFGDGVVLSNRPYATHAWSHAGDYDVVLRAFNNGQPGMASATQTIHVVTQPIHYVSVGSTNPASPYSSWTTAAANIQDAVDATTLPGALVLVADGVYATGGRGGNRLRVDRPLSIASVNGAQVTVIDGGATVGCVYLADGATLSGFTLTNGQTPYAGGGVSCQSTAAAVSDCALVGNVALYDGGGGAYGGTLNRCRLTGNSCSGTAGGGAFGSVLNGCRIEGNSAAGAGGGACLCTLNNCTVTGNSSKLGGGGTCASTLNNCTVIGNSGSGVLDGILNNCIVYFNAPFNAISSTGVEPARATLNFCCTTPLPPFGTGSITNPPLFLDQVGGNLRLQQNSPCINAGNNSYVAAATDLDGNPRTAGGTVDIGAFEFQNPASIISYAWLQRYGLPMDGSADFDDADHDGMNNWQEWRCGTDPTNAASVLTMLSPTGSVSGVSATWQSVQGILYYLEGCTNLVRQISTFGLVQSNIVGQAGKTTFIDTNATGAGPHFYRVGVQ
jgi:PKD domain